MLLVIAILALLFALLFPALNPLKESTKFAQRLQLTSQLLYDQKSRALSGLVTQPQAAVNTPSIDAEGIRFSTNKSFGIHTITAKLKSMTPFSKKNYEIDTVSSVMDYNYLSDDAFFSGSGKSTPLATIESITLLNKGLSLGTANLVDVIYLPLSNDVIVRKNDVPITVDSIEIILKSTKLSTLNKKLIITPQTANIRITEV